MKVMHDTYAANALATGSLIEIGTKLPKGAYVYETILGYGALGANTSLKLGDAEDDDRYITNTATTSAGVTRTNAISGLAYYIDETAGTDSGNTDRQVLAKVVDSGAATGNITAIVMYSNN
jgi:hypothetical protein